MGLEKKSCVCSAPPTTPLFFFVMAPGRTCGGGGRGRRGAEGLICILLPCAFWSDIKACTGASSHQTHAQLTRVRPRQTCFPRSGPVFHQSRGRKQQGRPPFFFFAQDYLELFHTGISPKDHSAADYLLTKTKILDKKKRLVWEKRQS